MKFLCRWSVGNMPIEAELVKERPLRNYPATHHQLPPAPAKEPDSDGESPPQAGAFQRHRSKADEGHKRDPTDEQVAPPSAELGLGRA